MIGRHKYLGLIEHYREINNYEKMICVCLEALQVYPTDELIQVHLAYAYNEDNIFDTGLGSEKALELCKNIGKDDSFEGEASLSIEADIYYRYGNYSKAKEILEGLLKNNCAGYFARYAVVLQSLGDTEGANRAMEKAVELEPNSLYVIGEKIDLAAIRKDSLNVQLDIVGHYMKAGGCLASVNISVGNIYLQYDYKKEALEYYAKALVMYPKFTHLRQKIEQLESELMHDFKKLNDLEAMYNCAENYYSEMRYEESLAICEKLLIKNRCARSLILAGYAYDKLNKFREVRQVLDELYEKYKGTHVYYVDTIYARALYYLGEYEKGREIIENAIQNRRFYIDDIWVNQLYKSLYYYGLQEEIQVMEWIKALPLEPTEIEPCVLYCLGKVYEKYKDYSKSAGCYKAFLSLAKCNEYDSYIFDLIRVYIQIGKYRECIDILEGLINKKHTHWMALVRIIQVYVTMGNHDKAKKYYDKYFSNQLSHVYRMLVVSI